MENWSFSLDLATLWMGEIACEQKNPRDIMMFLSLVYFNLHNQATLVHLLPEWFCFLTVILLPSTLYSVDISSNAPFPFFSLVRSSA